MRGYFKALSIASLFALATCQTPPASGPTRSVCAISYVVGIVVPPPTPRGVGKGSRKAGRPSVTRRLATGWKSGPIGAPTITRPAFTTVGSFVEGLGTYRK